jgi:ribonuclease HI
LKLITAKKLGNTMTDYDIIAYTDGACKGNPSIGGWGIILVSIVGSKEFNGMDQKLEEKLMEGLYWQTCEEYRALEAVG